MNIAAAVLLAFGVPALLVGQNAGAMTGIIRGVVKDAATEAPVRRAIVTLSTVEQRPQEAVAWTDAEGRFAFGYLPAGRYRLTAWRSGYQNVVYGGEPGQRTGTPIALTEGQQKNDLVLKMAAVASISGTVVDEDGDPLSGVRVGLLAPGVGRGGNRIQMMNTAMTDSKGHYRIMPVIPREYVITAVADREAAKGKSQVKVGEPQEQFVYEQQYYPGAFDIAAAGKLKVKSGQSVEGINFRLTSLPMANLKGRVILPPGVDPGPVQVMVMQAAAGMRNFRGAGTGPPEYVFGVPGLRPGVYRVTARATLGGKEYTGVQQVQVGRENDIVVTLEGTVDLAGTVRVEGPDAAKYTINNVGLSPGDESQQMMMGRPVRAQVAKDGAFKLVGVPPGIWDINVGPLPPGGYIKSMKLGDQDVLTEEMKITSGTNAPLKIVVSTAGAVMKGHVDGLEPGMRAFLLLAPTGKFEHVDSFRKPGTTDDNGDFEIKSITPGAYKLYVSTQPLQGPEPLDLSRFEDEATGIELKEGQVVTQNVKPMTLRGANQ